MQRLILASAALALAATAANAEPFSFTARGAMSGQIAVQVPSGPALASGALSGSGSSTSNPGAKGVMRPMTYSCMTWTTPGEMTASRGLCDVSEGAADTYAIAYNCGPAAQSTQEAMCWGLLVGKLGRFANKTGSVTWIGTMTASTGQGAWRD